MKTLGELRREAEEQKDCMENPRLFLAIFPSGPKNGHFLDPYLGGILIRGIDGVIHICDLDKEGYGIPAIWADGEE